MRTGALHRKIRPPIKKQAVLTNFNKVEKLILAFLDMMDVSGGNRSVGISVLPSERFHRLPPRFLSDAARTPFV